MKYWNWIHLIIWFVFNSLLWKRTYWSTSDCFLQRFELHQRKVLYKYLIFFFTKYSSNYVSDKAVNTIPLTEVNNQTNNLNLRSQSRLTEVEPACCWWQWIVIRVVSPRWTRLYVYSANDMKKWDGVSYKCELWLLTLSYMVTHYCVI